MINELKQIQESLVQMTISTNFMYDQLLPYTEGKRAEINEAKYCFILAKQNAIAALNKLVESINNEPERN